MEPVPIGALSLLLKRPRIAFKEHFDLIVSDRRSNGSFGTHFFRKPFHAFRDAC